MLSLHSPGISLIAKTGRRFVTADGGALAAFAIIACDGDLATALIGAVLQTGQDEAAGRINSGKDTRWNVETESKPHT